MQLSNDQKQAVSTWAADGAGLSEIQTRLTDEFGIRLSYMETRFLILELGAQIKDKTVEETPKPAPAPAPVDSDDSDDSDEDFDIPEADAPSPTSAAVSVDINPITRPGFALTGTVVFSDGIKAEWGFTNDGRFALDSDTPAYKPTAEDIREFQTQLRKLMAKQGY